MSSPTRCTAVRRWVSSRRSKRARHSARHLDCSLLVLDTLAGSHAETVYRHLGWHKVGDVPDYAAEPDGTLHATAIHYKRLR